MAELNNSNNPTEPDTPAEDPNEGPGEEVSAETTNESPPKEGDGNWRERYAQYSDNEDLYAKAYREQEEQEKAQEDPFQEDLPKEQSSSEKPSPESSPEDPYPESIEEANEPKELIKTNEGTSQEQARQQRKQRKQQSLDYDEKQDIQMSFVDHLEELRKRFIYILIFWGILTVVAIAFSQFLVEFIQEPYTQIGHKLITTRPTGAFLTRLKLSFITGFVLSLPFILHQLWLFIFPALSGRLKKLGTPLLLFAFLLFLTGVAFNYIIVLPLVLNALIQMAWEGVQITYNVDDYYGFVTMTSIVFGAIFEMPIVVLIFVRVGLLTHRFLLHKWRASLVIGAVIASFLTPPDVVSMVMMIMPMILLYLLSIAIAYIFRRRDLEDLLD